MRSDSEKQVRHSRRDPVLTTSVIALAQPHKRFDRNDDHEERDQAQLDLIRPAQRLDIDHFEPGAWRERIPVYATMGAVDPPVPAGRTRRKTHTDLSADSLASNTSLEQITPIGID